MTLKAVKAMVTNDKEAKKVTDEASVEIIKTPNFLKKGKVTIAVTSGASTPDKSMEDSLERIFMLSKLMQ